MEAPDFLFLLAPPYSGSTVAWRLLQTSPAVSALPREGQMLPEVREVMRERPWDPDRELPWPRIREVWTAAWDLGKPLLLEKSPPNLVRAHELELHFAPAHFLVMMRDPYAHAEGLRRHSGWSMTEAASFWVRCARHQLHNQRTLGTVESFTYEELTSDPDAVVERLIAFLPALERLEPDREFLAHSLEGKRARRLQSFNERQWARLSARDLRELNAVLDPEAELLAHFGYARRTPRALDGVRRSIAWLTPIHGRLRTRLERAARALRRTGWRLRAWARGGRDAGPH